jgi:hypothetical protein
MKVSIKGSQQLVAAVPQNERLHFLLKILRRMGAYGIQDAAANSAMMQRFGKRYRHPHLLMQTLMVDLARHCRLTLTIAPCCCRRMTSDEAQLIEIFSANENNQGRALYLLSDLTGNRECRSLLATIEAASCSFASYGCPLND